MAKRAVPAPRPLSRDYMHTSAPLPETHYSEPAEVQIGSSWL
jgi:hypothetical protein